MLLKYMCTNIELWAVGIYRYAAWHLFSVYLDRFAEQDWDHLKSSIREYNNNYAMIFLAFQCIIDFAQAGAFLKRWSYVSKPYDYV